MRIFLTSDLHFGHANIIKYCDRPYASPDEMDAALINNWNARVAPTDTVWVLGDVFFRPAGEAQEIISQLNGFKKLVLGNHDKVIRNQAPLRAHFNEVYDGLHETYLYDDECAKVFAVLCHYPMLSWNRAFHGSIQLHGHVHSRAPLGDGKVRRYDVGVDANNYAPVSLREVLDALATINSTTKPEY
jgi:calcineurin-like phosphoesterase family protein